MVQVPESSQSDYSILRINMQSGNKAPEKAQPTAVSFPTRSAEDDALSCCGGNDFDREDESDNEGEGPDNEELYDELYYSDRWGLWALR